MQSSFIQIKRTQEPQHKSIRNDGERREEMEREREIERESFEKE